MVAISIEGLDEVAATYRRNSQQDFYMRDIVVAKINPYLNQCSRILELGCSDGYMSEQLAKSVKWLDVVEIWQSN